MARRQQQRRKSGFDYFTAWWRGDEIHAGFAKLVAKVLRAAAFETRRLARDRLIRREYWTMRSFKKRNRMKRVAAKKYRAGGRRRRYAPSKPGQSPTNQTNVLKASILYDFEDQGDRVGSIIGPISLPQSQHWSFTDGLATHALEYGGKSRNHGGKMVDIEARPFMRPAQADLIQSGFFDRSFSNQLARYVAPTGRGQAL